MEGSVLGVRSSRPDAQRVGEAGWRPYRRGPRCQNTGEDSDEYEPDEPGGEQARERERHGGSERDRESGVDRDVDDRVRDDHPDRVSECDPDRHE